MIKRPDQVYIGQYLRNYIVEDIKPTLYFDRYDDSDAYGFYWTITTKPSKGGVTVISPKYGYVYNDDDNIYLIPVTFDKVNDTNYQVIITKRDNGRYDVSWRVNDEEWEKNSDIALLPEFRGKWQLEPLTTDIFNPMEWQYPENKGQTVKQDMKPYLVNSNEITQPEPPEPTGEDFVSAIAKTTYSFNNNTQNFSDTFSSSIGTIKIKGKVSSTYKVDGGQFAVVTTVRDVTVEWITASYNNEIYEEAVGLNATYGPSYADWFFLKSTWLAGSAQAYALGSFKQRTFSGAWHQYGGTGSSNLKYSVDEKFRVVINGRFCGLGYVSYNDGMATFAIPEHIKNMRNLNFNKFPFTRFSE